MVKKWISAAAVAALLALPVVGVNSAQAGITQSGGFRLWRPQW